MNFRERKFRSERTYLLRLLSIGKQLAGLQLFSFSVHAMFHVCEN